MKSLDMGIIPHFPTLGHSIEVHLYLNCQGPAFKPGSDYKNNIFNTLYVLNSLERYYLMTWNEV